MYNDKVRVRPSALVRLRRPLKINAGTRHVPERLCRGKSALPPASDRMNVYAIADLHLSLTVENKSMDVFGERWRDHIKRLETAWRETVGEEDTVLINGDISWAMHLEDAREDLAFIGALPGKKVLLRGNHDYWWPGYGKLLASLPPSVTAVQNNTVRVGGITVGGTRGWNLPGMGVFEEERDRKIYEREKLRLSLSLRGFEEGGENYLMLHFPPFTEKDTHSEITEMIEASPVKHVVYGHLHGIAGKDVFEGEQNGVTYHFTAADRLHFMPKLISGALPQQQEKNGRGPTQELI